MTDTDNTLSDVDQGDTALRTDRRAQHLLDPTWVGLIDLDGFRRVPSALAS